MGPQKLSVSSSQPRGPSGEQFAVSSNDQKQIDYKTHILIGVRGSGVMTVICHWHYLPRQTEVQHKIATTHESYDVFLLCTPTSIMAAQSDNGGSSRKSSRPLGFR
jgi:hypothetical protein